MSRRKAPEKMFFVVPLHFFGSTSTVLVSAFVMGSTFWSVSCLLFFYSRCPPPCPAIYKSRGHVPPVPYGVGATVSQQIQPRSSIRQQSWSAEEQSVSKHPELAPTEEGSLRRGSSGERRRGGQTAAASCIPARAGAPSTPTARRSRATEPRCATDSAPVSKRRSSRRGRHVKNFAWVKSAAHSSRSAKCDAISHS